MPPSLGTQPKVICINYITQHQIYFQRLSASKISFYCTCSLSVSLQLKSAPWRQGSVCLTHCFYMHYLEWYLMYIWHLINICLINQLSNEWVIPYFETQQLHFGCIHRYIQTGYQHTVTSRSLVLRSHREEWLKDAFYCQLSVGYIASCHLLWLATGQLFHLIFCIHKIGIIKNIIHSRLLLEINAIKQHIK